MTWSDFYLICFAVGFLFSLLSFVAGGLNMHGHWPHVHFHSGTSHAPAAHAPTGHGSTLQGGRATASVSPFNFFTIAIFLAWFGGTGYLLTRFSTIVFVLGLLVSTAVGLVGASIVFLFLAKVLMSPDALMDPADYEMVGVVARVCGQIREGGTGEIIYSQAGSRRACPARSEDSVAIERDAEVVVTRYEKGIAYIRRWEEVTGE
jgi:hypothetical protein